MLQHKHLIIRSEITKPPKNEDQIVEWAKQLIQSIGMKIMMGPYAKYCKMPGNRGFTCVTIIETSHIAIHIWDEVKPALVQLDVYTCGDLDKGKVFDALERWDPVKVEFKYLDREKELIEV